MIPLPPPNGVATTFPLVTAEMEAPAPGGVYTTESARSCPAAPQAPAAAEMIHLVDQMAARRPPRSVRTVFVVTRNVVFRPMFLLLCNRPPARAAFDRALEELILNKPTHPLTRSGRSRSFSLARYCSVSLARARAQHKRLVLISPQKVA
jgi:hypothetical protein